MLEAPPAADAGWEKLGRGANVAAAVFTVAACAVSARSMARHLARYRRPDAQRLTVRVLWMVPIYAVSSLVSLNATAAAHYIEAARDLYEALVLWFFFALLVALLGGERDALAHLQSQRRSVRHMFPVTLFARQPFWDVHRPTVFLSMKRGILQFVFAKPVFAILTLALKRSAKYQEGFISASSAYVYISLLYNVSVSWSLYCLVMFYMACKDMLEPYRPLPKFLCIKAILFFSFWQGVAISILVYTGVIHEAGSYTTDNISQAIQDFLVCVEMLVAALAHDVAFSPNDYQPASSNELSGRLPFKYALRDALGTADLASDVRHTLAGTRFAATSAAEHLLERLSERQRSRVTAWLARLGYRRRFRAAAHVSTHAPGFYARGDHTYRRLDQQPTPQHAETDELLGDAAAAPESPQQPTSSSREGSESPALFAPPPPPPIGYGGLDRNGSESSDVIDLDVDPVDEALYRYVRSFLPNGDWKYPVVAVAAGPGSPVPSLPVAARLFSPSPATSEHTHDDPLLLSDADPDAESLSEAMPGRPRAGSISRMTPVHPYRALSQSTLPTVQPRRASAGVIPSSSSVEAAAAAAAAAAGQHARASSDGAALVAPASLRVTEPPGPPPREFNPL